jgi:amidohydrolase
MIVAARRHLHAHPELSFEEVETTRFLAGALDQAGISHGPGPLETGLVAEIGGGERTIGLRADIDAINVQEESGLPFSSRFPGKMHACGHDGHAAILLGTALILKEVEDRLPGRVRMVFQPAEEANPSGGRLMIERGFLDQSPPMEELYALHLQPSLPVGMVGVKTGTMMASADGISVRLLGKGGHAAAPHEAVDAIAMSAQVIDALQYLVSRRLNPVRPVVLSFGIIQGGTRHSVIASEVVLKGTLRCVDGETRERALELIRQTVESVATGFGGAAELTVQPSQPVTRNHPLCVERVVRAAGKALGSNGLMMLENPAMTAEDFSRFAERVPAAIFWLGAGVGDNPAPLHSSRMVFPEEAMAAGVRVFAHLVADFFNLS